MRPLEVAIVLPQKWCISPARSQANERLAVRNPLPMTRSMKQFAENLRLRDIMVTLRPIIGARTFPLPDGISGPPAAHLTILKA